MLREFSRKGFVVKEEQTIFDKIKAKEIPAKIIYEDEHVLAFHDISPQAPTHVLVIPQEKIVSFADFTSLAPEKVGNFMQGVAKVADQLGLKKDGYRIVFNHGKHGQQTVAYIHAHIIGGRQLQWPPG